MIHPVALVLLVSAEATVVSTKTLSPFASKALKIVSNHKIVKSNNYCQWFGRGEATIPQAKELVKQFSVFSNLFLLAQLNKIINAPTLDDMREGKARARAHCCATHCLPSLALRRPTSR